MSKVFNIYENIENIDPAELKRAAGLKDPDKVTWPKGKKYKVQLGGKECSVTTYFSNAEESAYGQYDAYSALSTMMTRDEVVEKMWKEDPNGRSDAVNFAQAEFLPGLPELTEEEKKHRKAFTAAILTLLSDQKTMELIAECAPRKKNGLFHKGRVFKIGLTGFADKYSNELIEIVGRSKDETKLSISVTGRGTAPDELAMWNQDFISTYHEGLPISEALNKVFEAMGERAEQDDSSAEPEIADDIYKRVPDELKPYLICQENIDFTGKTVVFDYSIQMHKIDGKWVTDKDYYKMEMEDPKVYMRITGFLQKNDPENPFVKAVIDAGGTVRRDISGKTDYYVKDTDYPFTDAETKNILEQKKKGKELMIIPIEIFKHVLSIEGI